MISVLSVTADDLGKLAILASTINLALGMRC